MVVMSNIKYIREIFIIILVVVALSLGGFAYYEMRTKNKIKAQLTESQERLKNILSQYEKQKKDGERLQKKYDAAVKARKQAEQKFKEMDKGDYDRWLKNYFG
jgi:uncharacterized protein HemX